jgi:hypothetical protein
MRRCALRGDQWDRIEDILPGRAGHVGVTAKDNRLSRPVVDRRVCSIVTNLIRSFIQDSQVNPGTTSFGIQCR